MSTTPVDPTPNEAEPDCSGSGGIAPEDSFLVQIRSSSRLADQVIGGRIEHLHSGTSEQFGSVAEMLDFLARHFGLVATTDWSNREEKG